MVSIGSYGKLPGETNTGGSEGGVCCGVLWCAMHVSYCALFHVPPRYCRQPLTSKGVCSNHGSCKGGSRWAGEGGCLGGIELVVGWLVRQGGLGAWVILTWFLI